MDVALRAVCLLGFLVVAAVTDIRQHKIFNRTTYPGILSGISFSTIFYGWVGFQDSVLGVLVCGTIMVVCFVLFDIGGGDVKLIAMMGAFFGIQDGIEAMLWTFIFGSMMGIVILIWKFGILHIIKKTGQHIWLVLRAKGWIAPDKKEREPLQRWLFLAPAAFLAACVVLAKPWLAEWGILY